MRNLQNYPESCSIKDYKIHVHMYSSDCKIIQEILFTLRKLFSNRSSQYYYDLQWAQSFI